MRVQADERAASSSRLRAVGAALCLLAAALGALDVLAHAIGVSSWTAVVPGRPQMALVTGVMFVLAGVSGAGCARSEGRAPRWARLGGAVVATLGAGTSCEYLFGVDLGIDWLMPRSDVFGPHPGRPSPLSGLAVMVLGTAIALVDARRRRFGYPREWLGITAGFLAFASLVGHLFGAGALYEMEAGAVIGVALPTSIGLVSLAAGVLLARPQLGVMSLATSPGPGGVTVRRLGVLTALVGPVLGALFLAALETTGLRDVPLTFALGVVLAVSFTIALVVLTARSLEQTHERLQLARDRVTQLLAQAPDGVLVTDFEGRYIAVNEAACRMLGYTRGELLGKAVIELIRPEDEPRLWEARERQQRGETHHSRWLLRRKDGSELPVDLSARILEDGRWQAIIRDVSERVRLERELDQQLREQAFLARAGVVLAECLTVREVLDAVSQLVVDSLGDLCAIDVVRDGKPERAVVRHRDPDKANLATALLRVQPGEGRRGPIWDTLKSKTSVVVSDTDFFRHLATTEQTAALLVQLAPRSVMVVPLLARGQLLAVLSVASCQPQRCYGDSDLRLAEELARRAALALDNVQLYAQSRLQAVLTANLAEGVVLVRRNDRTIAYANPRFEEMFGYASGELVGAPVHVLNASSDRDATQTAHTIIAELEQVGRWQGEVENVTKQGATFWTHASICTFEHPDLGSVWLTVQMDITERKRLERANEQALVEKEALLREIHHRVKNNLQVISSLFSLQRSRTRSEELRALLDESRSRVQSIALVHDHLYRSANLAAVDFDVYLRRLVDSIRSTYGDGHIRVVVEAMGIELTPEQAVPCALLLAELVSNAFRHAFGGRPGTVHIRAFRDETGEYVFDVADDGCGFPPDLDWQETKSLGLRLVRIFVKQLHGSIELAREDGTRFVIRFRPEPLHASDVVNASMSLPT